MLTHRSLAFFILTVFLPAIASSVTSPAEEPKSKEVAVKSNAKRPRPKITISKETTYITGPLRADGYVDYVVAINRHCSEGVTPENNAAIPFWQAVGPKGIDKKVRIRYFELLGIRELPEEGAYFIDIEDFLPLYRGWKQSGGDTPEDEKWANEAYKQFDRSQKQPWSRKDFPTVAALLERNAAPLNVFVEGTRRSHYYSPLVPVDGTSLSSTLGQSGMVNSRELIRCLTARAMLRSHEGKAAEAWQDLLACHRWARLRSHGPFLIDSLLATTWQRYSCIATAAMAHVDSLTSEQADAFRADLRRLPPAVSLRNVMDFGERLFGLGCVLDLAVYGPQPPKIDFGPTVQTDILAMLALDESRRELLKQLIDDPQVDWNEAFRRLNKWYDRVAIALDEPTVAARSRMLDKLGEELETLAQQAAQQASQKESPSRDAASNALTRQAGCLIMQGLGAIGPFVLNVENNRRACFDMTNLALVLAAYRHDHGAYPSSLAELNPKYITQIPTDAFTDGDLHYRSENGGYLLYGVGPNGKDDGGRNFNHEDHTSSQYESATEEEKSRDDIAIRTPRKNSERN